MLICLFCFGFGDFGRLIGLVVRFGLLLVPGSLCLWRWFWVLYCDVYVVVAAWRFVILVYGLVYSVGFVGLICGGCFLVI